MSTRLAEGGAAIDRAKRVSFTWNGERLHGYEGDTLASALLANGKTLVGRSFKYHRPRGIIASGPEEPNALVGLGEGGSFEPNQRATVTELFDGLVARSQNHWPSLDYDIGALNSTVSRFLPAGFYYKTFIHPRPWWKSLYEPAIRSAAGLGQAPTEPDADTYEYFYAYFDVVVVGAGIAGLIAAEAAAQSGARVLLLEQAPFAGGRARVDEIAVGDQPAPSWINDAMARLSKHPNVTVRMRTTALGVYDHGYLAASERLCDHIGRADGPRQRFRRIRATRIVTATGAI